MPITQTRMLGVINAGLDCYNALLRATSIINEICEAQRINGTDARDALEAIRYDIQITRLLRDPLATAAILAAEQKHFSKSARRNDRLADRQRERRGTPIQQQRRQNDGLDSRLPIIPPISHHHHQSHHQNQSLMPPNRRDAIAREAASYQLPPDHPDIPDDPNLPPQGTSAEDEDKIDFTS